METRLLTSVRQVLAIANYPEYEKEKDLLKAFAEELMPYADLEKSIGMDLLSFVNLLREILLGIGGEGRRNFNEFLHK